MNKVQPKEAPIILDGDTLMCDSDFMSVDRIKHSCLCIHNTTCIQIVKLLQQGNIDLSISKIEGLRNYIEG